MELSLCQTNAHGFCSSILRAPKTRDPSNLCRIGIRKNSSLPWQNHGLSLDGSLLQSRVHKTPAVVVRCADTGCSSGSAVGEVERELEAEMRPEDGAEWLRVGRLKEKCGEGRGVVELLECLEREAIMGEDEGKEPDDYNRRAQIFYKSSTVFQALKERTQSR